jgi:hypothetical protein
MAQRSQEEEEEVVVVVVVVVFDYCIADVSMHHNTKRYIHDLQLALQKCSKMYHGYALQTVRHTHFQVAWTLLAQCYQSHICSTTLCQLYMQDNSVTVSPNTCSKRARASTVQHYTYNADSFESVLHALEKRSMVYTTCL